MFRVLAIALTILSAQAAGGEPCVAEEYAIGPRFPRPSSANPVVVVLGSSTAAGAGASSLRDSWAAGLQERLARYGFELVNRSIPGTATAESLARFSADVTPHKPAFVFLVTSPLNDNFLAAPALAIERYRQNTLGLIERVRRIGAVPILMTMYPNVRFSRLELDFVDLWTEIAEAMGWPVLNFMSSVSDPAGAWIPGSHADGIHPSNPGHRQMLEAIPDSLFPAVFGESELVDESTEPGSWLAAETGGEPVVLRLRLATPLESFTLAAFFRDPAISETVGYLAAEGESSLRLSRSYDRLEVWSGHDLLWSRFAPGFGWRHLALSYQAITGRVLVTVDGVQWGELWAPAGLRFASASAAGNCAGCAIAHWFAYRSFMHLKELLPLAGHRAPRRSLEFHSALNTDPDQADLPNSAQTLSRITPVGQWRLDRETHPPPCAHRRFEETANHRGDPPR